MHGNKGEGGGVCVGGREGEGNDKWDRRWGWGRVVCGGGEAQGVKGIVGPVRVWEKVGKLGKGPPPVARCVVVVCGSRSISSPTVPRPRTHEGGEGRSHTAQGRGGGRRAGREVGGRHKGQEGWAGRRGNHRRASSLSQCAGVWPRR